MKFENVYFINGTAYAGKSTMVKLLAEKYDGIACEENYQDRLLENLDTKEFPNLTYTRDLQDWGEFVRRTPDEYEAWVNGVTKECTVLEIEILKDLVSRTKKKIFVDTNISVEILHEISDENHVLIMLADPNISVQRFFERPDKEKQFLYQLLLKEDNPEDAKLLYAIFLDRVSLSIKNGWVDENGRVFIYYSVINICEILNCGTQKACKLLDELETFGALERRRQGLGKPNKLYLKKVF